MKKVVSFLIIFGVIFATALIFFILKSSNFASAEQKGCIASGGTITTASCCGSITAFPNTCTLGSCGCSPAASHQVKSCACPAGLCFNGTSCVTQG